jgi:uncharacterized membrane protein
MSKQLTLGRNRIESFSDGVIAIIITLMILEIKLPKIEDGLTGVETWKQLSSLLPNLVVYLLSFLLLGIYWVNHHNFFHQVKHTDGKLLWCNLHLLFWLSLIPLPTAFLGEHPTRPEAVACYGFVMLCSGLSFTIMGAYANSKKDILIENISMKQKRKNMRRNIMTNSLYIVAIAAGYLSVYISFAIFALVAGIYFLPGKIELEG